MTESSVKKKKIILKTKTTRALSSGTYQARSPESTKNGNMYIYYWIGIKGLGERRKKIKSPQYPMCLPIYLKCDCFSVYIERGDL